jgi:hypothetical protein
MRAAPYLAGLVGTCLHLAAQTEISLAGVIDLHAHSAPDAVARSINSFEVVRQAKTAGMAAVMLKNHYVSTAALAQLAMQELGGGIEVFGGIVLNRSNGGINVEAVRKMAQVEGKRGKVVWMPTFDAENQVRFNRESRPSVSVSKDGQLLPGVMEVIRAIGELDLVMATGHSTPAESILLLEAARRVGVRRLLVTHVLTDPTKATLDEMKRMAELGGVMECTWLAHFAPPNATAPALPVAECARVIKAVGAQHFVLTSDLGQAGNPVHTVGLRAFIAGLKAEGISQADLDLMTRTNPARLLGLVN